MLLLFFRAQLIGWMDLLIDHRDRVFGLFLLQMKSVSLTATTPKAPQTPRRGRRGDTGEEGRNTAQKHANKNGSKIRLYRYFQ